MPELRVVVHVDPSHARAHQEASPNVAGGAVHRAGEQRHTSANATVDIGVNENLPSYSSSSG